MTEFTKDITQLTKTASSNPLFAAPSNSLGADLANLASTGLEFYAKNQAKKELTLAKEAASAQAQRMAVGQEKLRQIRMLSQQGVSATDIDLRETKLGRNYSAEEWWGIRTETNKVTGVTSAEAMSSADAALEKKAEDRENLQANLSLLAPYLPPDFDINGTDEELTNFILLGNAKKANAQYKKDVLDLESSQLTVSSKKMDIAKAKFIVDFASITDNTAKAETRKIYNNMDFNDPAALAEGILKTDELKTLYISQAVKLAADKGIYLTPNQAKEMLGPELAIFDIPKRRYTMEDAKTTSANLMKYQVSNTVINMKNAGSPSQKNLATLMMLSDALPDGYLQGALSETFVNAMAENAIGDASDKEIDMTSVFRIGSPKTPADLLTDEDIKKDNKNKQLSFQRTKDLFKNADANIPKDVKDAYTELVVLEDLQGSDATQEEMLTKGGFVTYVQAISKGTPSYLLSPEKQDKVIEGILDYGEKFLRRAIPQLLTEKVPADPSVLTRALPPRGNRVSLDTVEAVNRLNAVNPETLKVTWNQRGVISNNVKSYNKFIDEFFNSLDKLGATEEEINYLKTEIVRSFVVANQKSTTNEKQDYNLMASELGVDLSPYEDGDYELTNGKIITLKNGKVIGDK